MKEIELKVHIGDESQLPLLLEALQRYELLTHHNERDTYFTGKNKDFIATEECLRVRVKGDFSEITWKPPTTADMVAAKQYWKREINLSIPGQADEAIEMLKFLDFIEYVTIDKERREYKIDQETKIMVDIVKNAGLFIEIETMSSDAAYGTSRNLEILQALGISCFTRINRPYRDIVKDGRLT